MVTRLNRAFRLPAHKTGTLREIAGRRGGRLWIDSHNPTIMGLADLSGRLIPGSIFSGGLPADFFSGQFAALQSLLVAAMPAVFSRYTSPSEQQQAAVLIAECHRQAAERGLTATANQRFIAEALEGSGRLTVASQDYPGALEALFAELHARNYEVRHLRGFSFSGNEAETGFADLKYAVNFIFPEGYVSGVENQDRLAAKAELINRLKLRVFTELAALIPSRELDEGGMHSLVDKYFSELHYTVLDYANDPSRIAKRIKRFWGMKDSIDIEPMETIRDANCQTQETRIHIKIKDRHLTKRLADICEIIRRNGVNIQYLTIESLESEGKSVCAFSLNMPDGKPITEARFEEIRKDILDLTEQVLGKRSLTDNIIGPAMIPTSSSHTCGANRLARVVRELISAGFRANILPGGSTYRLEVEMCNTFQLNNKGSGTGHFSDEAVIAGLLGIRHDDELLKQAKTQLIDGGSRILISDAGGAQISFSEGAIINTEDRSLHPNTIRFHLIEETSDGGEPVRHTFVGESTGGGAIEILKAFGPDCDLQKKTGREPIRGNTPTYLIALKNPGENEAARLIQEIKARGYAETNSSSPDRVGNKLLVCLDRRISEVDIAALGKEAASITEVGLINDPLSPVDVKFSDFRTLLERSQQTGHGIADIAVDYEAGVKGKSPETVRREMGELLTVMFDSINLGLAATGSIFVDASGWQLSGNAHKMPALGQAFPIDSGKFAQTLTRVFAIKERSERGIGRGRLTVNLSEEDQAVFDKWEFLITAPYLRAVYDARGADIILREKYRSGTITPEDPFVRSLFTEMEATWRQSPTVTNLNSRAATYAMAANEWNARRGKIVAAPTAGACGIIPGVLRAMQEFFQYSGEELFTPERLTEALFVAGIIGLLFNDKLKMNGGNAGCQAEIGAATAMAAGAATELMGGNAEDIMHAVAIALKGLEGLTCTPTGGFVAYPCIIRNALGASVAITAATLAVNKIISALTPDAVMEGLIDVSDKMHPSLKETGTGGLAISTEGRELGEKLKGCQQCKGHC